MVTIKRQIFAAMMPFIITALFVASLMPTFSTAYEKCGTIKECVKELQKMVETQKTIIQAQQDELAELTHQHKCLAAEVDSDRMIFCDRLKDNTFGPEMVWIFSGRFRMGNIQKNAYKDEKPAHRVSIKSFAMGRYEVTFAEYDKFAKATGRKKPSDNGWGRGNHPVINIYWKDAAAYAVWLSQQTGKIYRLPTEAQWEYAARAGTNTDYWWGNSVGKNKANCDACGSQWDDQSTAPVGSFAANPFDLYDTVGNVCEWVADPWHPNYKGAPANGRVWKWGGDKSLRVIRGGAWVNDPESARATFRYGYSSSNRLNYVGFRISRLSR
jgi:formylglycine-generating enzyme required for sulfatase activity